MPQRHRGHRGKLDSAVERESPLETLKVGLIGTGDIAPAYMRGCAPFGVIEIVACADILQDKARAFAAGYGLRALSVDELLAREDIAIVINATVPSAHAGVSLQILEAGKHAYSEKPLAMDRAEAETVMRARGIGGAAIGLRAGRFSRRRQPDGASGDRQWRHWARRWPRPRF